MIFCFTRKVANGLRYPRVGGVWIRSEGSINPKPEKSLKMAADSHTSGARCVGLVLQDTKDQHELMPTTRVIQYKTSQGEL